MRHLRDARDLTLSSRDAERELLAALRDRARDPEQGGDHGRIDEVAVGQVDEHVGVRRGLVERLRQRRLRAEIVLPAQRDDSEAGRLVVDLGRSGLWGAPRRRTRMMLIGNLCPLRLRLVPAGPDGNDLTLRLP